MQGSPPPPHGAPPPNEGPLLRHSWRRESVKVRVSLVREEATRHIAILNQKVLWIVNATSGADC